MMHCAFQTDVCQEEVMTLVELLTFPQLKLLKILGTDGYLKKQVKEKQLLGCTKNHWSALSFPAPIENRNSLIIVNLWTIFMDNYFGNYW